MPKERTFTKGTITERGVPEVGTGIALQQTSEGRPRITVAPGSYTLSSTSVTPDFTNYPTNTLALSGATAVATPTGLEDSQTGTLKITQPASTFYAVTFSTGIAWPASTAPTVTQASSAVDIVTFINLGGSVYAAILQNFG